MTAETTSATPSRWRRRGRIAAIIAVVTLVGLAIAIGWVSRPARLTGLVLDRVGAALDLQITATGVSEYRLRGTPMLTIRRLDVRQPGASTPLLTAERAYVALPWATLLAGGEDLTIRRVELDGPHLDLRALQDWLATRAEGGPMRIPTLTKGLRITRGHLDSDGWAIDRINVSTDHVDAVQPLRARVAGRFRMDTTTAPFDVSVALTRPAIGAGTGIAGIANVRSGEWRMPLALKLSGVLRDGTDGVGLDAAKLGARVRWFNDPSVTGPSMALALGVAGDVRYSESGLLIEPLALAIRGQDNIPERLDATGSLTLDDALSLQLGGEVDDWPAAWPALPSPLIDSRSPFAFTVDYAGPTDLSEAVHLQLHLDETRLAGDLRLTELPEWMEQLAIGTPLPPLRGTLVTPRIDIAGATLTGIRLEIEDSDPSDTVEPPDPPVPQSPEVGR